MKGFGVRIMPSGTRTFFLNYRNAQGKQRRVKLGRLGIVTLEEARKKARQEFNKVADGHDPQEARTFAHGAITFAGLAEEYIKRRCSAKKSGSEDERMLRKDFLPLWGRKLARDIRRNDVMSVIDEIKKRGPVTANRSLFVLGRMFNFGIDCELVESNPATRVKPRKEKSRERFLNTEEIRLFWQRLENVPCEPTTRLALRLILVTAQRPGRLSGSNGLRSKRTATAHGGPFPRRRPRTASRIGCRYRPSLSISCIPFPTPTRGRSSIR